MDLEEEYGEDSLLQIAYNDHEDFVSIIVAADEGTDKYATSYFSVVQHIDTGTFYHIGWSAQYQEPAYSPYSYQVEPHCEVVTVWKAVNNDSIRH